MSPEIILKSTHIVWLCFGDQQGCSGRTWSATIFSICIYHWKRITVINSERGIRKCGREFPGESNIAAFGNIQFQVVVRYPGAKRVNIFLKVRVIRHATDRPIESDVVSVHCNIASWDTVCSLMITTTSVHYSTHLRSISVAFKWGENIRVVLQ